MYKDLFKLLSVPLILLAIYGSMALIWVAFDLPKDEALMTIIRGYFNHYGLWIVFISAIIEGFLLLGQYFPGSFVIFLGVVSAGKDISKVIQVLIIISLAFFISYTLNYWVGKYGWYHLLVRFGLKQSLENSQQKLEKQGLNTIFFSYWEPNLASLTATAAGVLKISLKKFSIYSAGGIIVWNILWGTLVYFLGEKAMDIVGIKYVLIIFVVWVAAILIKKYVSMIKLKDGVH